MAPFGPLPRPCGPPARRRLRPGARPLRSSSSPPSPHSHSVLAVVNKAASELSSHKRKVFRVAEHDVVALAGLTADSHVLSRFLRSECINHSFVYDAPLPVSRLTLRPADKAQMLVYKIQKLHLLPLPWMDNFVSESAYLEYEGYILEATQVRHMSERRFLNQFRRSSI